MRETLALNGLIKTRRNRKCKIPDRVLERWTMYFSPYKNCELKVKLWWVWTRERKKRYFLERLLCPKEIFVTFVFYLNEQCIEQTFRIYIPLLLSYSALYLTFYQKKIGKNEMLRHYLRSTDKRYQWNFPKVAVLKRSTKGAISSSFRRVSCK